MNDLHYKKIHKYEMITVFKDLGGVATKAKATENDFIIRMQKLRVQYYIICTNV